MTPAGCFPSDTILFRRVPPDHPSAAINTVALKAGTATTS
jgi:hypothetical protein